MVPLIASDPVQAPLAVQLLAFVDDHVSVALCPTVNEVGETDMVTVGAGAVTVKVALPLALTPAALAQSSE